MRTTIRLDDQLLKEAKQLAVDTDQTLTAVIEDALRERLARPKQPARRSPVSLTVFEGQGLQPGIDLDDSATLLELLEAAHDLD